jgi:hypothetical protein
MRSIDAAWLFGRKIATVASIVGAGVQATGLDLPDLPYGQNVPATFPRELDELA